MTPMAAALAVSALVPRLSQTQSRLQRSLTASKAAALHDDAGAHVAIAILTLLVSAHSC